MHICVDFLLPRISPNVGAVTQQRCQHAWRLPRLSDRYGADNNDWLIIPGHDWVILAAVYAPDSYAHHQARLDRLDAVKTAADNPVGQGHIVSH